MESKDEASDTDSGVILQSGEWLREAESPAPGWPGRDAQGLGVGVGVGAGRAGQFSCWRGLVWSLILSGAGVCNFCANGHSVEKSPPAGEKVLLVGLGRERGRERRGVHVCVHVRTCAWTRFPASGQDDLICWRLP